MSMEIQAALEVGDETDSFLQITDVIYNKAADVGFTALKDAEKTIYCIDALLREMENGGFVQFFRQEAGATALETLEALERIKARESALVFAAMLDYFTGRLVPKDDDQRTELFDKIETEHGDEIIDLDDEFHDSGENLIDLTLQYVQKNLKEFR